MPYQIIFPQKYGQYCENGQQRMKGKVTSENTLIRALSCPVF